MADDIRVPTVPVEVEFTLSDGETLPATIHLANDSSFHEGSETLDEFFNADRLFLPVHGAGGKPMLVGRRAIVAAKAPPAAPLLSRLPGRVPEAIYFLKVHLETGGVLEGTLLTNLRMGHSRVSDAFNEADEFVPIEGSDFVAFVCKNRVTRIEM
jgi:hypothetical protein